MPYIGNTVQTQGFAPAIDYFSGDGVTVTFTLSRPVLSVAQLTVAVDNVIQNPSSAFNVSGNSITFTSAPLSGTNNIWVEYTSLITTYAAISQDPSVIGDITATGGFLAEGDFGNTYIDGTIVDYVTGNARITTGPIDDMTFYHGGTSSRSEMMTLYYAGGAKIYGTTALTIPVGTTAERPGTPAVGMVRYNTTLTAIEAYIGSTWTTVKDNTYSIEYLIVAGGGAGGWQIGGGGGAGGMVTGIASVAPLTALAVTVGAGGSGSTSGSGGANGSNSVLGSYTTAIGGGKGGNNTSDQTSGGSGGGCGEGSSPGSGTAGQGNAGGTAYDAGAYYGSGGGGGAGAVGSNGTSSNGGTGGAGSTWSNGTTYAGGGAGGGYGVGSASGGAGGGGSAGSPGNAGTAGSVNTGGGGGGGSYEPSGAVSGNGGSGGSGIVIVRYLGSQRGTGGTVTSSGGYTYHTFTSSGTYTA